MSNKYNKPWWAQPEMMVGFSALVVSLVAVIVSVYSAYTDRAYARASVWPRLMIFKSYSQDPTSQSGKFSFGVNNNGTGPAIIKYAYVSYEGNYYRTWNDLIEQGLGVSVVGSQSHISNLVLPAYQNVSPYTTHNYQLVEAFMNANEGIGIDLCYCSIYEECWHVDRNNKPTNVARCDVEDDKLFYQ